jgi:hypothetical protein
MEVVEVAHYESDISDEEVVEENHEIKEIKMQLFRFL